MSEFTTHGKRVALSAVPKGHIVELIGFRNGVESGIGLRGVVRRRFTDLYPQLDLEVKVRLEILFADGREMVYPGKFEVYNQGAEGDYINRIPNPVVPGLRPLRVLIR